MLLVGIILTDSGMYCLLAVHSKKRMPQGSRPSCHGISDLSMMSRDSTKVIKQSPLNSATGARTRVARVRAEYPNQLDYSGCAKFSSQDAYWLETILLRVCTPGELADNSQRKWRIVGWICGQLPGAKPCSFFGFREIRKK